MLTLKKCGRNRPIEYFAMSVVSWLAAAPKPKTPIWRYAFIIHGGKVQSSITNLIFAGLLFSLVWINSVADICGNEKKKIKWRKMKIYLKRQVNDFCCQLQSKCYDRKLNEFPKDVG